MPRASDRPGTVFDDRGDPPGHRARRAADVEDGLRRQPERARCAAGGPSRSAGRRRASRSGTRSSHLPTSARSSGADGAGVAISTMKTPGADRRTGLPQIAGPSAMRPTSRNRSAAVGELGMVGSALVGRRDRTARRALEGASPACQRIVSPIMPNEPSAAPPHAREQRGVRTAAPMAGPPGDAPVVAAADRRRGGRRHRGARRRHLAVRRRAAGAGRRRGRRDLEPRRVVGSPSRRRRDRPHRRRHGRRDQPARIRRRRPPTRRRSRPRPAEAEADPHARGDPAARPALRRQRPRRDDPREPPCSAGSTSGASRTASPACRSRS